MARMARVVIPGIPHHITQRGNRRQPVFFCDQDYRYYKTLLSKYCQKSGTEVWAYCLLPNHVHLVMVPQDENGLHRSLAETHRRYTRYINFRERWKGYLWQGRFSSFPMDDYHLCSAVKYIELNPLRAGLCDTAQSWQWSSAKAHLCEFDDDLVSVAPMLQRVVDWESYLTEGTRQRIDELLRLHQRTGRPLGSLSFIEKLEALCGRTLRPLKSGPKKKAID